MKAKLALVAICAAIVYGADRLVDVACRNAGLANQLVDIQHPAMLLSKMDYLRQFQGRKVVLLGDSIVYGGILEDFGDRQWREHNLAQAVEQHCRELWPGEQVLMMNLGINGALPCDLEKLAPLVTACEVDCIMFDIHLRPFSSDFTTVNDRMARPWLDELALDEVGLARWRPEISTFDVQAKVSNWLVNGSAMFRNRQLLQDLIVRSDLAAAFKDWRSPPPVQTQNDIDMQALLKLGQLKQRLKNIAIEPSNPQVAALDRLLSQLSQAGQPYVVFYGKENPDLLYDVVEQERHEMLYSALANRIADLQKSGGGAFLPPVDDLRPDHFLDFAHLNVAGYQVLARHLVEAFPPSARNRAAISRLEQKRRLE